MVLCPIIAKRFQDIELEGKIGGRERERMGDKQISSQHLAYAHVWLSLYIYSKILSPGRASELI